jgi:predicted lipoprotein with Yx(FWY)xxD motif
MLGAAPVVAAHAPLASSGTTITVEHTKAWGPILALSGGWTVYRLTSKGTSQSTCSGKCAEVFPPVLLSRGQTGAVGDGVGHLGFIARSAGQYQVTYEGIPLYRYIGDKKAGQVNGNLKDAYGHWWVIDPAHPNATPGGSVTPTTVPGTGVAY